jgi:hypothetical protein
LSTLALLVLLLVLQWLPILPDSVGTIPAKS